MRQQRGFTLIELLVVIAIIGILATLVITQLSGAQTRARNSNAKSDVSEAGKAVETWKTTNNADNIPQDGGDSTTKVNNTTESAGWITLFDKASGAFPVRVAKTPSGSHTYTYETDTNAANEASVTMANPAANHYCVGTSVVSNGTVTDNAFYIMDGVSATKNGATSPAYANSNTPCT